MYMIFGIMMMFNKAQMSVFEFYHLAQSIWRWIIFIIILILFAVLLFIPVIKYFWLIPLVSMVVLWAIFVKQAWDWIYHAKSDKSVVSLLASLGRWLLVLFDVDPQVNWLQIQEVWNSLQQISDQMIDKPSEQTQISTENNVDNVNNK